MAGASLPPRRDERRISLAAVTALERLGRFAEALSRCEALAADQAADPEILHRLGLLRFRTGDAAAAIEPLGAAAAATPERADRWLHHGGIALVGGRLGEAARSLIRAAALAPQVPDAYFNLGQLRRGEGKPGGSVRHYRAVLALVPGSFDATVGLALGLRALGRTGEAIDHLTRCHAERPEDAPVALELGIALLESGRFQQALAPLAGAVARHPDSPAHHFRHAEALALLRRFEEASEGFRRVALLAPDFAAAYERLARLLRRVEQPEGALAAARRALVLGQQDAPIQALVAELLLESGFERLTDADQAARRALELAPMLPEANAIGARTAFLGGRLEEAARLGAAAILVEPNWPAAQRNLIDYYLAAGDLERGWRAQERRRMLDHELPRRGLPPFLGTRSARGRRLLVLAEQGVGDEVLFASCLPDLLAEAEAVLLECDPRLLPLYRRSFPGLAMTERRHRRDRLHVIADYAEEVARAGLEAVLLVGSLPPLYRRRLADFPARPGYLRADGARRSAFRGQLASIGPGPFIGVSWRSGTVEGGRASRYPSLPDWLPLLRLPGVTFVSLQYGDVGAEIAAFESETGIRLHRLPGLDLTDDLDGVAALAAALDGVVTVETAVNALAGALGAPTVALCRDRSRSMLGTAGLPWYPNTQALVRGPGRPWRAVLEAAAPALLDALAGAR